MKQSRHILSRLFSLALEAVNGKTTVAQQLQKSPIEGNVAVIAIGKAAAAMMAGAKNQLGEQIKAGLIITKVGHCDEGLGLPCIESGHPVPDQNSLIAGDKLIEFLTNIPENTSLLALISGGASALVEVLPDGMDLKSLQKINQWLLGSGLSIQEMNKVRQSLSLIKGGQCLNYVNAKAMTQYLISDVEGNHIESIGSGLFVSIDNKQTLPEIPVWIHSHIHPTDSTSSVTVSTQIIACNEMACQAIAKHATKMNYNVTYHGQTLYGDVVERAEFLVNELNKAEPGLHIWGGETTIKLPENPGQGGRNQSLALELACSLENRGGISILVGATDGSDGPTEDAGAIVDGFTLQRAKHLNARTYLERADAGAFLAESGDLLSTGPTGTNVMDIVIALKEPN